MLRVFAILLLSLVLIRPVVANEGAFSVGWIAALDDMTDEIILHDGRRYVVSPDINFEMLAPGMRVLLEFRSTTLRREVSEILPVPPFEPVDRGSAGV